MSADKIIHLVYGPTAGGKSAFALDLAARIKGVIINADSMQLYDALPTLTAQPPAPDLAQCPHKLYAILPPGESCSAARWRDMAVQEITQAWRHGHYPVITGGTGFYIKALLDGLSPIPAPDDAVTARLQQDMADKGAPALHARLAACDPAAAKRIHANDRQRLLRAISVYESSGKPLSYWQSLPPQGIPKDWQITRHFINPARAVLHARCDQRFDMMMESGVLEEVRALQDRIAQGNVPAHAAITKALGYAPLCDALTGRTSLQEAIASAKAQTRQYAKRQITWFRHQI